MRFGPLGRYKQFPQFCYSLATKCGTAQAIWAQWLSSSNGVDRCMDGGVGGAEGDPALVVWNRVGDYQHSRPEGIEVA